MSHRPHPTKNKHLPEGTEPRWWYITYYPEGRKGGASNLLFEGTRAQARALDIEMRKTIRKTAPTVNPQFAQVVPDFVEHYKLERLPRAVERCILSLSHLQKFFGRSTLAGITPALIEQYKRQRVQHVKPITVNKELNALSCLLKWAEESEMISQAPKVKLFPGKLTKSPVPIMPTAQDFVNIIEHIHPRVRGLAMLEFYAGLRRNEALHLKAEDVLLERKMLIITGKGGKQRIVPVVHPPLWEELERKIKEHPTGYLWISPFTGRPYLDIIDSIRNAAKRAGVKGRVYNHLLRHGFGTTALESGIDLRSVQGLMGHSTSRTTEIYTHLAATHLRGQMEKFKTDED